jgi:hypothetical protein
MNAVLAVYYFLLLLLDYFRERRRQDQEKELQKKAQLKRQRRDLEQLSSLEKEVEEDLNLQGLKRARRQVGWWDIFCVSLGISYSPLSGHWHVLAYFKFR